MRWKVFYIDGSSFSNVEGPPEDAPGGGVLAIAQEDSAVGCEIHHGNDFYAWDQQYDGWYGLDYFGLTQYLMRPGTKIIKLGEAMSTERYRLLLKDIKKDPGLPTKSAHYSWEGVL